MLISLPVRYNRTRKWVWELFEEPNKTKLGKVWEQQQYKYFLEASLVHKNGYRIRRYRDKGIFQVVNMVASR